MLISLKTKVKKIEFFCLYILWIYETFFLNNTHRTTSIHGTYILNVLKHARFLTLQCQQGLQRYSSYSATFFFLVIYSATN